MSKSMATVRSLPPCRMSYLLGMDAKALCPNLSLPGRQETPIVDGTTGRVSVAITKKLSCQAAAWDRGYQVHQ